MQKYVSYNWAQTSFFWRQAPFYDFSFVTDQNFAETLRIIKEDRNTIVELTLFVSSLLACGSGFITPFHKTQFKPKIKHRPYAFFHWTNSCARIPSWINPWLHLFESHFISLSPLISHTNCWNCKCDFFLLFVVTPISLVLFNATARISWVFYLEASLFAAITRFVGSLAMSLIYLILLKYFHHKGCFVISNLTYCCTWTDLYLWWISVVLHSYNFEFKFN